MAVSVITLNYRYRLYPTPDQQKALNDSMFFIWRGWNMMCRFERQARAKIEGRWSKETGRRSGGGRAQEVRRDLAKWVGEKKPVGRRVEKLRRIARDLDCDEREALRALNREDIERAWKKQRSGLSVEYALMRADRVRGGMAGAHLGNSWARLQEKYKSAWESCWKGIRKAPRRKPYQRATWIQAQVQGQRVIQFDRPQGAFLENWVSISAMLAPRHQRNGALKWAKIIQHRPLPDGATIKQLIVTRSSVRPDAQWFVVLSVDLPDEVGQIDFPATGRMCGIDPGRKTALTIVSNDVENPGEDGIERGIGAPFRRQLKKLRRLQRKLDRQRRANNKECFREDGTWIKGRKCVNFSKRMLDTQRRLTRTLQRTSEIRKNGYHQIVNELLCNHDTVYLERWRDPSPQVRGKLRAKRKAAFKESGEKRKRGAAQLERLQNRADRDNALGVFRQILAEKAKRSKNPKAVQLVEPRNTTRRCVGCGSLTGPTGRAGLKVRQWSCSKCGKTQSRDRGAAWNILQAGSQAEVQSVTGGRESAVARSSRPQGGSAAGRGRRKAPSPGRSSDRPASSAPARANSTPNSGGPLATVQPLPNQEFTPSVTNEGASLHDLPDGSARDGPKKDQ